MKVLLVDDDFGIVEAIRDLLQDEGYEVSVAMNGREALDEIRLEKPPCVILLDLMMPVMNGWEFREEQLRDRRLARIPTLIVTADRTAQARSEELRPAELLSKPVKPERLLELIEKHCPRRSDPAPSGSA